MTDLFRFDVREVAPKSWRQQVNHESPKALRIRKAVQDIYARGQYPGHGRVQREIGDTVNYNLSGRDNTVRKAEMRSLGVKPATTEDYFGDIDYDVYY